MKKILLIFTLSITIFISGCYRDTETDDTININEYTEQELIDLIETLLPEANISTTYDLESFQAAVTGMISVARNGVIGITSSSIQGSGTGSGVIYKQVGTTYYVVTNAHVVTYELELLIDDLPVIETHASTSISIDYEKNGILFQIVDSVELLGYDITTDLAVITFQSDEDFQVIPIADSYELEVGEFVFAIGNPLGFEYYGTVTMGVISGLARYVTMYNDLGDLTLDASLLQHDAAISPGNSGGALLNINGELIGINNMKSIAENVSNIGFAIPSNTVKRIVEDLEDDGIVTRPYLGILTYAQYNVCGTDYGVCVDVQSGGAADEAGLIDGDTIIGYKNTSMTEFHEILNFDDLREAILNSQVGEEIQLRYIREGEIEVSGIATLGTHPDDY